MSAPRLHLTVNLLCANAGPLPDTCPNGVQVKLLSVLSHQKHCVFYLETGAAGVLCSLRTVPSSGLEKWAETAQGPCLSPGELCQEAGWVCRWPSTRRDPWVSLWVMLIPLHTQSVPAVSSANPCVPAAKLSSPAARFSDALGLGKGSWVAAAVWRPRSPTYALFQKLPLTICPLRASYWDRSFCFRLLAFV